MSVEFRDGVWWVELPNGGTGILSEAHTVTTDSQGLVTVWPSIVDTVTKWHGWYISGKFKEDFHEP